MSNLRVDDITATKNLTSTFQKVKSGTDSPKKDLDLKKSVEAQEPEMLDEPILRENKNRFVLFPIKYNDVSTGHMPHISRILTCSRHYRSGKCTRKQRPHSGLPRRLICPRISTTGTIA